MIIYTPDVLRASVEAATGGRVTVLYDDTGAPSYMCVVPKFRYEDLGLDSVLGTGVATAFSVNGVEKSEIFIGQYQASVINGRAVSLPGRAPRAMISYTDAKASCVAKGPGWHLMTAHEWAAIALWCKVNRTIPRGNTDFGRAHDATHETGHVVPLDGLPPGASTATATGSGPASWRHDGTIAGIADLVGNLFEWTDLLKTVMGQIYTTQDNDYTADVESEWDALDHHFLVDNANDSTVISLQNTPVAPVGLSNVLPAWTATEKVSGYVESQLLQRLLISPTGLTGLSGICGVNSKGEYLAARGGFWVTSVDSGLAALLITQTPMAAAPMTGFRPAFIY